MISDESYQVLQYFHKRTQHQSVVLNIDLLSQLLRISIEKTHEIVQALFDDKCLEYISPTGIVSLTEKGMFVKHEKALDKIVTHTKEFKDLTYLESNFAMQVYESCVDDKKMPSWFDGLHLGLEHCNEGLSAEVDLNSFTLMLDQLEWHLIDQKKGSEQAIISQLEGIKNLLSSAELKSKIDNGLIHAS